MYSNIFSYETSFSRNWEATIINMLNTSLGKNTSKFYNNFFFGRGFVFQEIEFENPQRMQGLDWQKNFYQFSRKQYRERKKVFYNFDSFFTINYYIRSCTAFVPAFCQLLLSQIFLENEAPNQKMFSYIFELCVKRVEFCIHAIVAYIRICRSDALKKR